MSRASAINSVLTVSRDRSRLFAILAPLTWAVVVGLPMIVSFWLGRPLQGTPLLGVIAWLAFLRVARWLSPAARADALIRRGRYAEALSLCEQSLNVRGEGAWLGSRRLVWLNRHTTILLALGQWDTALDAALEAMRASPDPETIANCAQALLRLNRYDEAVQAARLALDLTRERSVNALATMASVMLARGMPAEAEALARAGLTDVGSLLPLAHPMSHMLCLTTLARAERAQKLLDEADARLAEMQKIARHNATLRAMALIEEAASSMLTQDEEGNVISQDDLTTRAQVFKLLAEAYDIAPYYTLWYISQPGTFETVREDARLAPALKLAKEEYERLANTAPDAERVKQAVAVAQRNGRKRPARQANQAALGAQAITLAATLVLLLLWMWRFFIIAS